jgi:hypothetical protein
VWSTEDIEAYTEMLNGFTEMLEPRDVMELIWTKEAADATWEAARFSREKNSLPEQKYQERLRALAQLARRTGADGAKPASAFDHSLGLQAGCKYYQPFDIGQSRAIKRRDNALRQIARWRDGLGAKARRLSDKFIAEQALVERYGATELLADAEADAIAGDSVQAALSLASPDEAADAAPPVPPADRAAEAAPSLASAPEPLEPAAPLRISDEAAAKQIARHLPADTESDGTAGDAMQVGPPLASAGDAADPAPPVPLADGAVGDARWLASSSETAEIAAPLRASDVVVDAAPPVAPGAEPTRDASPPAFTGEGTDAAPAPQGAPPDEAAEAAPPHAPADDEPIPELAHYLPAIAQAAPTVAASAEAPQ